MPGLFTPTEAAAVSAVYAFVIAVFVYRDMSLKDVPRVLLGSANMSAMILYIITNAVLFSFLMANENIPQQIAAWITSVGVDWIIFLLIVNVLLLVAGNVMEAVLDRADHGADPVSGGGQARHPSGASRHPDGRQHGSRHVPSAGRASTSTWPPASPRWASPN